MIPRDAGLKHHSQPHGGDDRGIRARTVRAKNLQIARELEPRCEMEVVERFDLWLDLKTSALCEQSDVVLQLTAQICVRVGDTELIALPAGKESVAAETNVKERRHRARGLIREGDLSEESPSIAVGALHEVLPEGV